MTDQPIVAPIVAIVTGASRGAGRGIAVALGSHGATVYVTGRSEKRGDHALRGTIHETAEAITAAGGTGIAVRCDHGDDAQVEALIAQVEREQGRIDILVNNAAAIYDSLNLPGPFWEKPIESADLFDVGLRSGYIATHFAGPILARQGKGLVVFTSGSGAVHYAFGPAYGVHKAGMDKMASDMAVDFRPFGVAALSIWMGALHTERMERMLTEEPEKYGYLRAMLETPGYTGHIIAALYNDPELMRLSGQTLIGAELAPRYGLLDQGDVQPPSYRDTLGVKPFEQFPAIIH
jgi:NAD(P)-dependent dehydrogenase (short-subunit alcohol dehydrogenase family)